MTHPREVAPNEKGETAVEKKVRVQLDFDQKDMNIINDLVADLALGNRAELFRSALRVLRWMAQKMASGCTVVAITPEERYIEPDFEFFHHIKLVAAKAEPADTAEPPPQIPKADGDMPPHG